MSAVSRRGRLARCRPNRGRRGWLSRCRPYRGRRERLARCRPTRAARRFTMSAVSRASRAAFTMSAVSRASRAALTMSAVSRAGRVSHPMPAQSRMARASHPMSAESKEWGRRPTRCRPYRGRRGRPIRCPPNRGRGACELGLELADISQPGEAARGPCRDRRCGDGQSDCGRGARQPRAMRKNGSRQACRPSVRFPARATARRGACPSVIDDHARAAETPRRGEVSRRLRRSSWLRRFYVVMPAGAPNVRCRPFPETGAH